MVVLRKWATFYKKKKKKWRKIKDKKMIKNKKKLIWKTQGCLAMLQNQLQLRE